MLKRKIQRNLDEFLNMNQKCLFVDGARQVGKTFILREFQKKHFRYKTYINLATDAEKYNLLRKAKNADDFYRRLTLISPDIGKNSSSVFIDELQVFYDRTWKMKDRPDESILDVMTMAKDLVQNYPDRFIFSGSLLGFVSNQVSSWPAGYCYPLTMYPLDFEEFVWANGVSESIFNEVKGNFEEKKEVPDYIHDRMLSLFHLYILIGGMPEAVSTYVTTHNLSLVEGIHSSIENSVRYDIVQYAPGNQKIGIQEIYHMIPEELNAKNKRFQISDLTSHYHGKDETPGFLWIKTAGVAIPAYNVSEPVSPLLASKKRNLMKVYLEDTGLLTYLYFDSETKAKLLDGELKANYGAVYENVAAMELHAHGFSEIYYYNSKKYGEVDFLIEKQGKVIPLEIKSGKDYTIHHALNNLLSITDYGIEETYVFGETNVRTEGKISYLPIYMIDFIKKK